MNRLKAEAGELYRAKMYVKAADSYEMLRQQYPYRPDPAAALNLAHCYFELGKGDKALVIYDSLIKHHAPMYASVAWCQKGVMTAGKNPKAAKTYFEQALLANPENKIARYNLELMYLHEGDNPQSPNKQPKKVNAENSNGLSNQAMDIMNDPARDTSGGWGMNQGSVRKISLTEAAIWLRALEQKEKNAYGDYLNNTYKNKINYHKK